MIGTSRFKRRFGDTLADPEPVDGFLRPLEVVDPDEDALIETIRSAFVADTRQLPPQAGKDDPGFHEPHWGHGTGLLRGTLEVDRISALPERFRVGLFAKEAIYPVVARPQLVIDPAIKLAAGRMAVKLQYPEPVPNVYASGGEARELDLLFAEGMAEVNGRGHAFFLRDARELAMAVRLKPTSPIAAASVALDPRNWGLLREVQGRISAAVRPLHRPPITETGWAGRSYFSAGPFALGDGAMKLCLRPRQEHRIAALDTRGSDPTVAYRAAMEAWIAAGREAVFDLCVQLATAECIPAPGRGDPPKSVMIAEYCDLQWDEVASPYLPVAALRFEASESADLSRSYAFSPLQYNAWNTLPEMRPLGQLFRIRRHVHGAHSEARLAHVYDAQPGAMVDRAPFADG